MSGKKKNTEIKPKDGNKVKEDKLAPNLNLTRIKFTNIKYICISNSLIDFWKIFVRECPNCMNVSNFFTNEGFVLCAFSMDAVILKKSFGSRICILKFFPYCYTLKKVEALFWIMLNSLYSNIWLILDQWFLKRIPQVLCKCTFTIAQLNAFAKGHGPSLELRSFTFNQGHFVPNRV